MVYVLPSGVPEMVYNYAKSDKWYTGNSLTVETNKNNVNNKNTFINKNNVLIDTHKRVTALLRKSMNTMKQNEADDK